MLRGGLAEKRKVKYTRNSATAADDDDDDDWGVMLPTKNAHPN